MFEVVKNFGQPKFFAPLGGLGASSPENFENLHLLRRNLLDFGGLRKKR